MLNHKEEQERIKNQTVAEWISEYSCEPIKEEIVQNGQIDDNYGVDF